MNTIHLISHTHWDREWYLTFQQFRLKLIHLIDLLLEILEADPMFKYFLLDGQTILLEDYLQIRPEKAPELRNYINTGRILIGPWYISPDEFLVAPESHIRNLLEGDRLCQQFGRKMMVGYLPDTFGHIGQMPQILTGFGIDAACLWRGLDDQPTELIWKSPDGSCVILSYLRDSYSNAANLTTSDPEKFAKDINEISKSLSVYSQTGNILLMSGTDHIEPPVDLTCALNSYRINSHKNELIHSSLTQYFDAIHSYLEATNDKLPEVYGELRSSKHAALLQNVLSTRIVLKQRNHACENDLIKWVEPFSAWGNLLEQTVLNAISANNIEQNEYLNNPKSIIRQSWRLLLQCQPHDSICGTSIDQVVKEMGFRFDQVDQINHEMINQSLQKMVDHIDTSLKINFTGSVDLKDILSSLVVFNPNNYLNTGLVSIKYKLEKSFSSIEMIDDSGKKIIFLQTGLGRQELISMVLDKKGLKQALGMVHEGNVTGLVIRDVNIERLESQAIIQVTLSDHGQVDLQQWKHGLSQVEAEIIDPEVKEYIIRAYSDPEISLSFIAQDVPAHGFRTYWIHGLQQQQAKEIKPITLNPLYRTLLPVIGRMAQQPIISNILQRNKPKSTKPPYRVENEFFIVEAEPSNGTITVLDKQNQQLFTGLNRFVDSGDCGDLYNYCPPLYDQFIATKVRDIKCEVSEIDQRLMINYLFIIPCSISEDRKTRSHQMIKINLESEITLVSGVPRVDVYTKIDNQATDHRLRVHFPAPFESKTAWHDGHFEIVERQIAKPNFDETWEEPPRPEVPQREFTSVTDGLLSLTIANLGLPEVEVMRNEKGQAEIALTLLRCVGWLSRDDLTTRRGHAGPMNVDTPDAQMLGRHAFYYSIIPNDNNWYHSIHLAQAFNAPLRAMKTTIHSGLLPSRSTMINNQCEYFIITAIKQAENDTGLIVRGYNILSTPIDVSITPWRPFRNVQLVNLEENKIRNLHIASDGQINIRVGGNKISSIHFFDRNS